MIKNSLSVLSGIVIPLIKDSCVTIPNDPLIPKQMIDLGVSEMDKLLVTIGVVLVGSIIIFGPDVFKRLKHR